MSPKEFVARLNEEGCDITLQQYQTLCEALCVHKVEREPGVREYRKPRAGAADIIYSTESEIEKEYSPEEKTKRKQLRNAMGEHLNRTYAANKFEA